MGYIKHHGIVVSASNQKYIKNPHEKALEIFGETVTEIIESGINGYVSFFIAPDGSKEGWEESDRGDLNRDQFKNWVKHYDGFIDCVEIYYGGDEPEFLGIENIGFDCDEPD